MAESIIINRIGGKNKFITVPTDLAGASAFAGVFLEGEWATYEKGTPEGSDVVTVAPDAVNLMYKNKATGLKGYATILVKATKSDSAIFTALMGLTLNGVLIDEAYILSRKTVERF